jgi:hypothetical protein
MKSALMVVLGILLVVTGKAKAVESAGVLASLSAANVDTLRFPAVSFADLQAYAPSENTDWIDHQAMTFSPLPRPVVTAPVRRMALITRDSSKEMAQPQPQLQVKSRYHVSGEVGALYGVSTGKYGAESEAGYIIGGVGNDRVQFTAGVSYENTTFHLPRAGR